MRFVIQRVNRGCVKVSSQTVGQIGKGLMILVGLSDRDTDEHIDHIVDKFLNIRLFDDEKGNRWKESVKSLGLEILLVSQFTLYHVLKGNKPDFHEAMGGEQARVLFDKIVKRAREKYDEKKIQTGAFGEYMQIDMECDGPVTINWEYPQRNKHNNEDNNKKENKNGKEDKKGGKKKDKEDKKDNDKDDEEKKLNRKQNKKKSFKKNDNENIEEKEENEEKKEHKKKNLKNENKGDDIKEVKEEGKTHERKSVKRHNSEDKNENNEDSKEENNEHNKIKSSKKLNKEEENDETKE